MVNGPADDGAVRRQARRGLFLVVIGVLSAGVGLAVARSGTAAVVPPPSLRSQAVAAPSQQASGIGLGPAIGPSASPAARFGATLNAPPAAASPTSSELSAISCASGDDCVAVGNDFVASASSTTAELWNGSDWSLIPSEGNLADEMLTGVSCSSLSACTAVGSAASGGTGLANLIEEWNGATWTIEPSPSQGTLEAVSCPSAAYCAAVGLASSPSGDAVIDSDVSGSSWQAVASPHVGAAGEDDSLTSVSCVTDDFCVAVGSYGDHGTTSQTLVESWNGSSWQVMGSADAGGASDSNALNSVSCLSRTDCVAVGSYDAGGAARTLVESYDGTSWSLVSSPDAGGPAGGNTLNSVSCNLADACTAVGDLSIGDGPAQTLVEFWDGTSWSLLPSLNYGTSGDANVLNAVSCVWPGICTAVGAYGSGIPQESMSLVETP
ncbi:MAG TPA: hypothetical protein VMD59_09170 [Acidimicrobiales bacterium]|nr:hypothetical protein [Acidimicrobiales bacterium]